MAVDSCETSAEARSCLSRTETFPVNGKPHGPIVGGQNGRDNRGRFVKGNQGGPGRPQRHVEESYLSALSRGVSADDWEELGRRMMAQAKQGDTSAALWLSKYLLPPPRQTPGLTLAGNVPERIEQLEKALAEGRIGAAEALVLHRILELDARVDVELYRASGAVLERKP
jgi:hypothetical protein